LYLINNLDSAPLPAAAMRTNELSLSNSRQFTKEELSSFDGKNGNPAYVAVNGTVYDVTNNAAWGAATHFGLSAGNDLTSQFSSCHAGQSILAKLPVVGKMI
jgi:predicted heme/steroid binding protein